ncbi:MAG: type II toxin-antitoxin system HicB family antitoxin [Ruminococcus sp.]|nr:type II toxin-antitoxin system HicB family antitoxin [Ruminococcus sp.]MCD7800853.1 type II toxin-antitoxin system HicB family antitoxin [Ruminococcus sp.]
MLSIYPACFYEEENGQYSVIFPDLNHLATFGDNLTDAMEMAIDCLADYIYSVKLSNEEIPKASNIKDIDIDSEYNEYKSAFVNMVSVDVEEYAKKHFTKSVKKTLTIPSWLNEKAIEENINFSQLLQDALKERLKLS